ncbi:hypothetical protein BH23BAC1_BH23BAC1_08380 [soil metagenome]
MENKVPAETRFDDLTGAISVNFKESEDFNSFANKVARVNLDKYQPIAVRIYISSEVVVTIFALVKANYETHKRQTGKTLVRKFKVDISLQELFTFFKQMDFTLVAGDHKVEDFEVII